MPLLSSHCTPASMVGEGEVRECGGTHGGHRHLLHETGSDTIPTLLAVSQCFLFLTFLLHVFVPELRQHIFDWMKMCTLVCLFMGKLWFLIISVGGNTLLYVYSIYCQFSFLAAFSWMSAMAWELSSAFRQLQGPEVRERRHRRQRSRFLVINLCCWGLPFLVTSITLTLHLLSDTFPEGLMVRPGLGQDSCFFSSYISQLFYFHGLIAGILLVNLGLFFSSAYSLLCGVWAPRSDFSRQNIRQMFWIVLELSLVMGLTWLADVFSLFINWHSGGLYVGIEIIVFDVLNTLQGLVIFLALLCKSRIRSLIRSRFRAVFTCFRSRDSASEDPSTKHVHLTIPEDPGSSNCETTGSKEMIPSSAHSFVHYTEDVPKSSYKKEPLILYNVTTGCVRSDHLEQQEGVDNTSFTQQHEEDFNNILYSGHNDIHSLLSLVEEKSFDTLKSLDQDEDINIMFSKREEEDIHTNSVSIDKEIFSVEKDFSFNTTISLKNKEDISCSLNSDKEENMERDDIYSMISLDQEKEILQEISV